MAWLHMYKTLPTPPRSPWIWPLHLCYGRGCWLPKFLLPIDHCRNLEGLESDVGLPIPCMKDANIHSHCPLAGTKPHLCVMEFPLPKPAYVYEGPFSSFNGTEVTIEPLPVHRRPYLGFRVEGSNETCFSASSRWSPSSTKGPRFNNMTTMSPRSYSFRCQPTAEQFRSHLMWKTSTPSPLVSFYTTWNAALRRRNLFIEWGATEIWIYAVYIHDHDYIYDAYEVAQKLDIPRDAAFFKDEILLLNGVVLRSSAPNFYTECPSVCRFSIPFTCELLLRFNGLEKLEEVQFDRGTGYSHGSLQVWLPGGLQSPGWDADDVISTCSQPGDDICAIRVVLEEMLEEFRQMDATNRLLKLLQAFGVRDVGFKACILRLALSGSSYQVRSWGPELVQVVELLEYGIPGHAWLFNRWKGRIW